MKKIWLSLLTACTLLFTSSCALITDFVAKYTQQTTTFTVTYDYGFHIEGKVETLLDGNTVFFNPAEYGFAPLLAGDKITVTYTGEMLMQETYPGTVVINGELKNIKKESAPIAQYVYKNSGWYVCNGEEETLIEPEFPEYVLAEDMSFYPLTDVAEGTTLYATYKTDEKGTQHYQSAYALYDYNPR